MPEQVVSCAPNAQTVAAGWYGKLPGLGDFATRRLPPAFVSRWDEWLQAGMHAMRNSAVDDSNALALADDGALALADDGALALADDGALALADDGALAPVRRFWLGPGVIDALAWGGLLMPSNDRAGRRFPLTVAQPMTTLAHAIAARRWFSSVVAAMRFTQGNEHTLDDFEECLSALPPPPLRNPPRADELLAGLVLTPSAAGSAWWCHGAATASDFLVFEGMPAPAALATLLEGPR